MLRFNKIIFENFLSFCGVHEFDFNSSGMHLIKGINKDADDDPDGDINSVGAGKSSFTFVIQYALFGQIEKKVTKDKIINKDAGNNLCVILEFSIDNNTYRIERYRKHIEHRDNVYLYMLINNNWKDISGTTPTSTQETINNLIIVNADTFLKSILFSREDRKQFFELTQGERIKIFENIIQLNKFQKYLTSIKQQIKDVQNKIIVLQRAKAVASSTIKVHSENIKHEQQKIQLQIEKLKQQTKTDLQSKKRVLEECENNITHNERLIHSTQKKLNEAKPIVCIQCGAIQNKEEFDNTISFYNERIDHYTNDIKEYNKKIKNINKEIKALTDKLNTIENENIVDDIDYSSITRAEEEIQNETIKLEKVTKAIKKLNNKESMLHWWESALDMKNEQSIKSHIMSKIIPVFNNLLYQNASMAYDNTLSVNIDNQLKETIIKDGKQYEYNELSTGEKLKLNLCSNLSIFDMTRINLSGSNILFLDEIFNNVDTPTVKKFINMFNTKYSQHSGVYVISHLKAVEDNIEPASITTIIKEDSKSSINKQ